MVLARFFAWLDRWLHAGPAGHESGFLSRPGSAMQPRPRPVREAQAHVALLSVDGGGQVLLCGSDRLTIAVGISTCPHPAVKRREDLFARARAAYHAAEHEGGVVIHSS